MGSRPVFEAPDFLLDMSPEDIHRRMMKELPEDIDDMPGGFVYDYTYPTALVASELVNYNLMRSLMAAFPEYAWGKWLDLHAKQVGLTRKEANRATGKLTVTGKTGTVIKAGSIFCTEAVDEVPCIEFASDKAVVIGESGSEEIQVTAVKAGMRSNVMAGTVVLMVRPISGIASIFNAKAMTGGTEEETDNALYERIYLGNTSRNYVGNDVDYIRWAKEVQGVGDCIVLPAWNGPGTVKLAIVDSNGKPANEHIVEAVYDHIISPRDRKARLLPAGCAKLTVAAATTIWVSFSCSGLLFDTHVTGREKIVEDYKAALTKIYAEAKEDGILIYNKARGAVTELEGVDDFDEFLMNGGKENITLRADQYPDTERIEFSTGILEGT